MNPITPIIPGAQLPVTEIAKNQPQYLTLPAYIDPNGVVVTRWQLTWRERFLAFWRGNLYLQVLSCNKPLQPIKVSIEPPELGAPQPPAPAPHNPAYPGFQKG